MSMMSRVIVPAVVATGVSVILILLLVLLLVCCRCALLDRMKRSYWQHKHKKKAKNGVFVVQTKEDENQLISNVIYKSKLPRRGLRNQTDSTASSSKQEGNSFNSIDATDAVEENKYESIEQGRTDFTWQLEMADILTWSGEADEQRHCESEEQKTGLEEQREVNREGEETAGGGDEEEEEGAKGRADRGFEAMLKDYQPLHSGDSPKETDVQYIAMDRPTRGIRKCYTFCGAPNKPYPIEDTQNFEPLLRPKNAGDLSNQTRNSSSLTPRRPLPIARCPPFRTSQNVETETKDISKHPRDDNRISLRKKRSSDNVVLPEPTMSLPKQHILGGYNQNERLSDSSDDLFKDAWWRSSNSLDIKDVLDEDLSPPIVSRREPAPCHAVPNSIYVQMEVGSPRLCRPPSTGQRARSATMPNLLEGNRSSMLSEPSSPHLSLWYPHLAGNVQFTAELMPGLPKPCCGNPHYVNFRGTLPSRF